MIDNAESALAKICEGNPGAINACCCIIKESAKVYPYVDGWEYIILLDKLEIYGSDIYVLWNDICQRGTRKMIAALRIAKNNRMGHMWKPRTSRSWRDGPLGPRSFAAT